MTQETHNHRSGAAHGRDGFVRSDVVDVLLLIVSLVSVVLIGTATG